MYAELFNFSASFGILFYFITYEPYEKLENSNHYKLKMYPRFFSAIRKRTLIQSEIIWLKYSFKFKERIHKYMQLCIYAYTYALNDKIVILMTYLPRYALNSI